MALKSARAFALSAGGLWLLVAAPAHRIDLALVGLLACTLGIAWHTAVGPALVGAALPFYFYTRDFGPVSFSPSVIALLITAAVAVAQGIRWPWHRDKREWRIRFPLTGYDLPVALFLAAALLSMLVTEYPRLSVRELRALILEPVLLFLLLAAIRPSEEAHRSALTGFLLAATFTAVAALLQTVTGVGGTQAEGVRRAQAWYPSPNHLALMLGRALPFVLALALTRTRAHLWTVVATGAVAVASALTFSLGAGIGALASTMAVLGLSGRRKLAVQVAVGAVALGALVSLLAVIGLAPERLNPLRATSGFRVELWLSSLQMVRDHLFLGVGLDNFVYQYQQVYLREGGAAEPNLSHPHNWVLHLWLQLGVLGLASFVWLVVRAFRFVRQGEKPWMAVGAAGSLAAMLTHGLIDNSYFLVDLAFVFWLTLALARSRR